jgi:hypothetical protein
VLKNLNAVFRVLEKSPKATDAGIEALRKRFGQVPEEYEELVKEVTELELGVDGQESLYIRIWGPKAPPEFYDDYKMSTYIPDAYPIGDDGGSNVLMYLSGRKGPGLYVCSLSDLDIESATWIAPSLRDLLENAVGIENFEDYEPPKPKKRAQR